MIVASEGTPAFKSVCSRWLEQHLGTIGCRAVEFRVSAGAIMDVAVKTLDVAIGRHMWPGYSNLRHDCRYVPHRTAGRLRTVRDFPVRVPKWPRELTAPKLRNISRICIEFSFFLFLNISAVSIMIHKDSFTKQELGSRCTAWTVEPPSCSNPYSDRYRTLIVTLLMVTHNKTLIVTLVV